MKTRLRGKLYETLRVDRAIRLVWESDPKRAITAGIVIMISGVLPVGSLYLIKRIIDEVVGLVSQGAGADSIGTMVLLVAAAAALAIVSSLVRAVAGWMEEAQSQIVTDHVQDILHEKSIDVDLAYYEDPSYHDTLHRAQEESPYRPSSVLSDVYGLLYTAVGLIGIAGLLAVTFHWAFVAILIISAVPVIFVRLRFSEELFEWHKSRTDTERRVSYLNFVLTGSWYAKDVRIYGLGQLFQRRSRALRDKLRGERLAIAKRRTIIDVVTSVSQTVLLFGSFGYVVVRALQGAQSIGDIVMLYQAFQRGQGMLQTLVGNLGSLYENNLFLSYLYDFLELPKRVVGPVAPKPVPQNIERGLTIADVRFRYQSRPNMVLTGLSMDVRKGRLVGVTGRNGAGKSTLVRLLSRLHDPLEGTVRLDGIDVREFDLDAYRSRVGVLFQDVSGYFVSAKENIWLGDAASEPRIERVKEAARKAGASDFIEELEQDYDTVLGTWFDDGAELSIGQWKKVVLARLLYSDRPILLLDEPTAALDPASEHALVRLLREMAQDRTILVVSHRLSTISVADDIYVVDAGAVIESGSHRDLLARDGVYAALCKEQAVV